MLKVVKLDDYLYFSDNSSPLLNMVDTEKSISHEHSSSQRGADFLNEEEIKTVES